MSWSFNDSPAKTFTIEILQDGRIEWFFRDAISGSAEGTDEEPERDLPESAIELLVANFSR